jgi:hypothetical protein
MCLAVYELVAVSLLVNGHKLDDQASKSMHFKNTYDPYQSRDKIQATLYW